MNREEFKNETNWSNQMKLINHGQGHELITNYLDDKNQAGISIIDVFIPFEDNEILKTQVYDEAMKKVENYNLNSSNDVAIKQIFREYILKGLQSSIIQNEKEFFKKIQADLMEVHASAVSRSFKPTNETNIFPLELREFLSEESYHRMSSYFKSIIIEFQEQFANELSNHYED